ncbi:MAG: 4Fe-4S binding protein, partial [Coriobacteriales bacterium]|nr:4Fe-4S binding protein [Coriobacteriales bacterium]
MKSKTLRTLTASLLLVVISIGFMLNSGVGTLSAIGWSDIALLCPLGALSVMVASKTIIPQAMISLGVVVALIVLFGRAFCAWICPIPVVQRIRSLFKRNETIQRTNVSQVQPGDLVETPNPEKTDGLTGSEKALLKASVSGKGCSSCSKTRKPLDSRHFILGGFVVSTAVFGFPVFCLVCPVGLTFGTILLVIRLFTLGDITWSLIVVPAILIIE